MRSHVTAEPAPLRPTVPAHSAARALNILGDRWTLMILHLCFLRVRRFQDFQSRIGIARSLLTDRLRRLEIAGVLERRPYQTNPPRDEYRLTEMGRDLYGVALMLIRWEKHWFYDPAIPAHRLRHSCGAEFTPELRCGACGDEITARGTVSIDGPGAGLDPAQKPRVQRRSIVPVENMSPNEAMLSRAFEVLSDRWTAHAIAAAFRGCKRFVDFQDELQAAPNILTERLSRLVDLGVLKRVTYQDRPPRSEYRLTEEGRDLFPLIVELIRWGDRWLAGDRGPPQILMHRDGRHALQPVIVCDQCGQPADAASTSLP